MGDGFIFLCSKDEFIKKADILEKLELLKAESWICSRAIENTLLGET